MPNYWKYITGDPMTTSAIAEKMVLMTGLATAEKVADAGGVPFDEITTPYNQTFYTDIFAIGVELTQKQIGSDQSGKLKRIAEEFAYSLNYARETLVAGLINNGTDATNYPTMLGVALFSATQPGGTGTWSNLSTAAALDITALEQMLTDRKSHLTLKGQKWLKLGPVNLVTPAELEITAKRILSSIQQPGTNDNDKNIARETITWTPGNQFLTDTNAYTMVPQGGANPLFLLKGNALDGEVQEDKDIRTLKKLLVAAMDETVGSLYPAGVQHNVGA
jgi:hypothetical protein